MTTFYLAFTALVIVLSILRWFSDFAGLFLLSGGVVFVLGLVGYLFSLEETRQLKRLGKYEPEEHPLRNALTFWLTGTTVLSLILFLASR